MFDWLFEGRTAIYCLIGVLTVVPLLLWWRTRKRNFLLAAAAIASLAGWYFILDRAVETPREQIVRKLQEMAAAVKARDADAIFKHIAQDFRFRGLNRAAFRTTVDKVLNGGMIEEVVIYDEEFREPGDERMIPVEFWSKPKAGWMENQPPAFRVKAKFVREDDGQWRMQWFEVYNPILNKEPMDIPLMP